MFIHGENDNFVKPKHSLSLFEAYPDKRKEILLVAGDHNSMRPSDTLNYISMFLHRYLLSDFAKRLFSFILLLFSSCLLICEIEQIPEPIKPFGRTANTTIVKCFVCKQVKYSSFFLFLFLSLPSPSFLLPLPFPFLIPFLIYSAFLLRFASPLFPFPFLVPFSPFSFFLFLLSSLPCFLSSQIFMLNRSVARIRSIFNLAVYSGARNR